MTLKLVIFDVDGTLVDSQAHILASMSAAFTALGQPVPDRKAALAIVGLSLPVAIHQLLPHLTDTEVDAIVEAYKAEFQRIRLSGEGASPLYPGTREMLEALSSNPAVLMGVATGKSRRGLDHLIETHGLSSYFVTCQVADDHPSKPHPAMIETALQETGVAPQDAIMVGDTTYDIEMGRAANVRTLGVSWGYHDVEQLSAADDIINSWEELPGVLRHHWGVG